MHLHLRLFIVACLASSLACMKPRAALDGGEGEHSSADAAGVRDATDILDPADAANFQDGTVTDSQVAADGGQTDVGDFSRDARTSENVDGGSDPLSCEVTLCIAGTGPRDEGGNAPFGEVCRNTHGIVEQCSGAVCQPLFAAYSWQTAFAALFARLDTNHDDSVDTRDEVCRINLAGYSWGGGDIIRVANAYLSDARVADARREIERLVLVSTYRPIVAAIDIPERVRRHWNYRYSVASASDCTASSFGGPYMGLRPRCAPPSACTDYDYSQNPSVTFVGATMSLPGSAIDHCNITDIAAPALIANLNTGMDHPMAPATTPVEIR